MPTAHTTARQPGRGGPARPYTARSAPSRSPPLRVALATAADLEVADQDEHLLAPALQDLDIEVDILVWDDPDVDWSGYDAVVVRSTWDYVAKHAAFLRWIDRVGAVTHLFNPPDVLRWNLHKGYLIELEDRGVPIVPTAWLGRGDRVDLEELAGTRGWKDVVIKPAVDAGARGLVRVDGDLAAGQAKLDGLLVGNDVMVQEFQAGILDHGELSVICIDGTFSHAVRKRAKPGDVRIQIEYGGTYTLEDPDDATRRLAEWIVETTGLDLLYARVDLIPALDGTWQLGELELAEPALYLHWAPGSSARLAEAIHQRLS